MFSSKGHLVVQHVCKVPGDLTNLFFPLKKAEHFFLSFYLPLYHLILGMKLPRYFSNLSLQGLKVIIGLQSALISIFISKTESKINESHQLTSAYNRTTLLCFKMIIYWFQILLQYVL